MQIAMYKGPAKSVLQKLMHLAVCCFDSVRQTLRRGQLVRVRYSHCELVIAGKCYSSSERDGGVRAKEIDLASGHWEVFLISGDEAKVLAWFREHSAENYDWAGIAAFVVPLLQQRPRHWFCSEACAAALGMPGGRGLTPFDLFRQLVPRPLEPATPWPRR